ncbi:hypothetical protein BEWA_026660 [Theileria equi strain WA]|uniref:Uncharacterized protein n=1 Tax=Theileria equi strain WA TaxID=1537102 RepID=L0AW40_THEEQ|nr:hypothetical protein BEWA_026660 [Theileria equi strain WA]AFZ79817.1 hypothetical protein BEWA_026660 [Theileria equi strain WA]|eukprot:XP_004829483.1 hypothetical protein BEWA_026660 [Theileria equi strain WA]
MEDGETFPNVGITNIVFSDSSSDLSSPQEVGENTTPVAITVPYIDQSGGQYSSPGLGGESWMNNIYRGYSGSPFIIYGGDFVVYDAAGYEEYRVTAPGVEIIEESPSYNTSTGNERQPICVEMEAPIYTKSGNLDGTLSGSGEGHSDNFELSYNTSSNITYGANAIIDEDYGTGGHVIHGNADLILELIESSPYDSLSGTNALNVTEEENSPPVLDIHPSTNKYKVTREKALYGSEGSSQYINLEYAHSSSEVMAGNSIVEEIYDTAEYKEHGYVSSIAEIEEISSTSCDLYGTSDDECSTSFTDFESKNIRIESGENNLGNSPQAGKLSGLYGESSYSTVHFNDYQIDFYSYGNDIILGSHSPIYSTDGMEKNPYSVEEYLPGENDDLVDIHIESALPKESGAPYTPTLPVCTAEPPITCCWWWYHLLWVIIVLLVIILVCVLCRRSRKVLIVKV